MPRPSDFGPCSIMNDAIKFDGLGDAFELMRTVIDDLKESARPQSSNVSESSR